jgi:hypothetical protein
MRMLGSFLMLLGVSALIVGLVTGYLVYTSGYEVYEKFEDTRGVISERMDDVKDVFRDIDVIQERLNMVMEDYEEGNINSVNDSRVQNLLRDIRKVSDKSMELKADIEDEIGDVEDLEDMVRTKVSSSATVAVVSLGSLILSGWIFGMGALLRRRK